MAGVNGEEGDSGVADLPPPPARVTGSEAPRLNRAGTDLSMAEDSDEDEDFEYESNTFI